METKPDLKDGLEKNQVLEKNNGDISINIVDDTQDKSITAGELDLFAERISMRLKIDKSLVHDLLVRINTDAKETPAIVELMIKDVVDAARNIELAQSLRRVLVIENNIVIPIINRSRISVKDRILQGIVDKSLKLGGSTHHTAYRGAEDMDEDSFMSHNAGGIMPIKEDVEEHKVGSNEVGSNEVAANEVIGGAETFDFEVSFKYDIKVSDGRDYYNIASGSAIKVVGLQLNPIPIAYKMVSRQYRDKKKDVMRGYGVDV